MTAFNDHIVQQVVRQATAGTTQQTFFGKAGFAGTVTSILITPNVAVAADPTNNRTFTVFNRGPAGAGTTSVATFVTSTAWVDNTDIAMTLSGTPANLVVLAGDRFEIVETVGGTGVAHGGASFDMTIARTDQS